MACFHPLHGFRGTDGGITWNRAGSTGLAMQVPCGQCIGCRLERSRQWAVRMMHEASLHDSNCFLTLTYSDEFLPKYGFLDKTAFPKFMKRLRKSLGKGGPRIKYFHCGEYGSRNGRPHYHAALFGYDFPDKELVPTGKAYPEWVSPSLARLWSDPATKVPLGRTLLGAVTFESAAYIARYVVDKVNGPLAELHYESVDPGTGEIVSRVPEFATMSRGGRSGRGIGHGWMEKYHEDVYPSDEVIVRGKSCLPPRYYDARLAERDPDVADMVKRERLRSRNRADSTPARLEVRRQCAEAQVDLFSREVG